MPYYKLTRARSLNVTLWGRHWKMYSVFLPNNAPALNVSRETFRKEYVMPNTETDIEEKKEEVGNESDLKTQLQAVTELYEEMKAQNKQLAEELEQTKKLNFKLALSTDAREVSAEELLFKAMKG